MTERPIIMQADAVYWDMAKGMGSCVRCDTCGREETVDPAVCLRRGWPRCCGFTMQLSKATTPETG